MRGEGPLRLWTKLLLLWWERTLPPGKKLAEQRVSVQLDGGRSRIRGPWRELRRFAYLRKYDEVNGRVDRCHCTILRAECR